jgi:hypothetical protein
VSLKIGVRPLYLASAMLPTLAIPAALSLRGREQELHDRTRALRSGSH